jgi:hypothetical protein
VIAGCGGSLPAEISAGQARPGQPGPGLADSAVASVQSHVGAACRDALRSRDRQAPYRADQSTNKSGMKFFVPGTTA